MQDFSIHRMFEISLHEFCFTIFHWEKTSPLVSHVSRMDMVNMCLGIQGGFGATCPEGKVLMQPSLACWTTTMGHINSRSTNIRLPENKVLPNLMVENWKHFCFTYVPITSPFKLFYPLGLSQVPAEEDFVSRCPSLLSDRTESRLSNRERRATKETK